MDWLPSVLDHLSNSPSCGYGTDQQAASEPTALAALALQAHGRSAVEGLRQLVAWQREDGSVVTREGLDSPGWPASLAILAWKHSGDAQFHGPIDAALHWLLETRGETADPQPTFGHDPRLAGWPWVVGTHSWSEPTALALLALRASGWASHPRAIEADRLLRDRLLPAGGCNYGNTRVLGQMTLPLLQPTGVVLTALAGSRTGWQDHELEMDQGRPIVQRTGQAAAAAERLERTLAYARGAVGIRTGVASLCWGLLGLAAFGEFPANAEHWLQTGARRTLQGRRRSPLRLALLALAAKGEDAPLITLSKAVTS